MSSEEVTQEAVTEETVETAAVDQTAEVISELKSTVASLAAGQRQLIDALKPKEQPAQLSPEEAQRISQDPNALKRFIEDQVAAGTRAVKSESERGVWDRKTYEDFPALKTDKAFYNQTGLVLQELVASGEYQPDHPKLAYRAAEIAAARYKKVQSSGGSVAKPTSLEPSRTPTATASKSKINADTDPRVRFAREAGVKNIAKFIESLPPYVATQRKQGRTLLKGDR
jgi:hypothetical protein